MTDGIYWGFGLLAVLIAMCVSIFRMDDQWPESPRHYEQVSELPPAVVIIKTTPNSDTVELFDWEQQGL